MHKDTTSKTGILIKSLSRRTNSIPADPNEQPLNSQLTDPKTHSKSRRIIISSFSKKDNLLGRARQSGDLQDADDSDSKKVKSHGLLPSIERTVSGSLQSFYLQTEPSKLVRVFSKQLHQIQTECDISFEENQPFVESVRQDPHGTTSHRGSKLETISSLGQPSLQEPPGPQADAAPEPAAARPDLHQRRRSAHEVQGLRKKP